MVASVGLQNRQEARHIVLVVVLRTVPGAAHHTALAVEAVRHMELVVVGHTVLVGVHHIGPVVEEHRIDPVEAALRTGLVVEVLRTGPAEDTVPEEGHHIVLGADIGLEVVRHTDLAAVGPSSVGEDSALAGEVDSLGSALVVVVRSLAVVVGLDTAVGRSLAVDHGGMTWLTIT